MPRCVVGYELWAWNRTPPRRLTVLLRRAALAGLPLLPVAALFVLLSPTPTVETGVVYVFWQKTIAILVPMLFYEQAIDFYLMAGIFCVLTMALAGRLLSIQLAVVPPAVGLAAAVVLVPNVIFGNWGGDFRLVVPLVLVLIAGLGVRPGRGKALAVVGFAALARSLRCGSGPWRRTGWPMTASTASCGRPRGTSSRARASCRRWKTGAGSGRWPRTTIAGPSFTHRR